MNISDFIVFQSSQVLKIRLGFIGNRKCKSTWWQVHRNTKPNQTKFLELILDLNAKNSDFLFLFLQFHGRNFFDFPFLVTGVKIFFKNFYVVQGFLLRVLVFKFFCKLFNFFVADVRKPARHAFLKSKQRTQQPETNSTKVKGGNSDVIERYDTHKGDIRKIRHSGPG